MIKMSDEEKICAGKPHWYDRFISFVTFLGVVTILAFMIELGSYKNKIDSLVETVARIGIVQKAYADQNDIDHQAMKLETAKIENIVSALTGKAIK